MPNVKKPTFIMTVSGRTIDYANPDPSQICLSDLAYGLSKEQRFNNQLEMNWSVGQHSLLVASLVGNEHKCAALLHDAHEAYTGDISTPLKRLLGSKDGLTGIYEVQHKIDLAIYASLGVMPGGEHSNARRDIKDADEFALQLEAKLFIKNGEVFPDDMIHRFRGTAEWAFGDMKKLSAMSPECVAEEFCKKYFDFLPNAR